MVNYTPEQKHAIDCVKAYLNARKAWLAGNSNPIVQKTVYCQDAIIELIKTDNWGLKLPFAVRGVKVG